MAIELDNSFTVPVPPEQAWNVLLDVERIAPCMPGASVLSVDGDKIEGQVKVKLGPLSLSYKGTAEFTEKDEASHTIGLKASGKETRGAGTASANVQASLKPGDATGSTLVSIHTSLNVTGRPAQFGRSLLPEVSGKLIGQFATNLEALIQNDGAAGSGADSAAPEAPAAPATAVAESTPTSPSAPVGPAAPATAVAESTPTSPSAPAAQPEDSLNIVKLVGVPVLKRVAPVLAGAAVVALLGWRIKRRFGK
ncbi:MAG TPA: SRPBCC family protein [Trebonia sp.]|jgi:carbon monoxide dehydrogenase subunit G